MYCYFHYMQRDVSAAQVPEKSWILELGKRSSGWSGAKAYCATDRTNLRWRIVTFVHATKLYHEHQR